jgi:hypothetical protein
MPVNKNLEQQKNRKAPTGNAATGKAATGKKESNAAVGKSVRKAPGTRMGTLADWRSDGSGKTAGRHGRTIRDGR